MLTPFQGSTERAVAVSRGVLQRTQLGPQLLLQPAGAACSQHRSAHRPAGLLAERGTERGGRCCVSGHGTRRAHHAIACPAWLPDNPSPFKQSHLNLHAVFYIFEALAWAKQWPAV